jgi:Icc-related predicted phosphoesterase
MPKLSFITDYHGNINSVDAFLKASDDHNVDHIIFGGDIAPKKMAFALEDGLAVPTHQLAQVGIHPPSSKESMQRKGYMLKPILFSANELRLLASVEEKIVNLTPSNDIPLFTEDEMDFLEAKFESMIMRLYENDPEFKRVLNGFIQQYNKSSPSLMISTPQELTERFILNWKLNAIMRGGRITKEKLQTALGLASLPSDKGRADLIHKGISLDMVDYRAILRAFMMHNPWNVFEREQMNLHEVMNPYQIEWSQDLINKIRELKTTFKGTVSIILGNDDHTNLLPIFDQADAAGVLTHATNRVVQLTPEIQMFGYSHVPHHSANATYRAWFRSEAEIANELAELQNSLREGISLTIGNIHGPPTGIGLDQAVVPKITETTWGSQALAEFIESVSNSRTPIHLALCGHIHHSWKVSGKIHGQIGQAHVYNPGYSEEEARILIVDTQKIADGKVIEIKG